MSETNGHGPQIKRREAWVELPDEYEGFRVRVWVNAPAKLWGELDADDEAATRGALSQLILEHNGWLDFEGQPFSPASDPAFWDEIPTELAACLIMAAQAEMRKLPNSLAPTNRRSRSG